jgi:hypothetical protein
MKQNDKREETLRIGTCMTRLFLISHTLVWLGLYQRAYRRTLIKRLRAHYIHKSMSKSHHWRYIALITRIRALALLWFVSISTGSEDVS